MSSPNQNDGGGGGTQGEPGDPSHTTPPLPPAPPSYPLMSSTVDAKGLPADAVMRFIEDPDAYESLTLAQANNTIVDEDTLLNHCIKRDKLRAVECLLLLGTDPNAMPKPKGMAPLTAAAHKGYVHIMEVLIKHGALINSIQPSQSSSTALIQASHFNHLLAVELLLKEGALVDFANVRGTTALMRSSQEGNLAVSRALVKYNADVNKKNLEGMSALMLASQRGHGDMAELLIRAGANIDDQTTQGSTALMLACKRGNSKCVLVLVRMGAELFMRDCKGRNAKETAIRKNHNELLPYLDSQEQINLVREHFQEVRKALFKRIMLNSKALELTENEANIMEILDDVHVQITSPSSTSSSSSALFNENNQRPDCLLPLSRVYRDSKNSIRCNISSTTHAFVWPKTLQKSCAALPVELCGLVVDFIPTPRIWSWTLKKLKQRCKLAPQHAISDLCVVSDEILADANIFRGKSQKNLLLKISQNPETHRFLIEEFGMPADLLSKLITWSDLQSVSSRLSPTDVAYSPKVAKDFLKVVSHLHEWYQGKNNAQRALRAQILLNKDGATATASGGGSSESSSSATDIDQLLERMKKIKLSDTICSIDNANASDDSDDTDTGINYGPQNHQNQAGGESD